jgi:hypothetical protein
LDIPTPLPQTVEAQLIGDFGGIHCVGKILFVCKYEKKGIAELVFIEHALEFLSGFRDTFTIIGVDYEDDALGVLEIYGKHQKCARTGRRDKYNVAKGVGSCLDRRHPKQ